MTEQATERLWVLGPVALVAFFLTVGLMVLLRPWLARYAMVQPNARSSHHKPTPQGGGIAVVVATLVVAWGAIALSPVLLQNQGTQFLAVSAATALLGAVGAIDDMRSLPATVRLATQCIAVGAVITALPAELQIFPHVPWAIERAGLFLGGIWFVNLVNFMDGIDWMTVAEAVPVTGVILVLGFVGVVAPLPALLAAALLGAIVGFAPFNKPVAQIFLGDVGSLPIGLLLGWLLLLRGDAILLAHRAHFYQRATDRGLKVPEVVARVFVVNLALAGLAFITVAAQNIIVSLAMLTAAAAIVYWLLAGFASGKDPR